MIFDPEPQNPYSAWFGNEGSDFTIANREPKEDSKDFTFEMMVDGEPMRVPLRKRSMIASGSTASNPDRVQPDDDIAAIVAVIDDGVNFGHPRFHKVGTMIPETRVAYAWVQDGNKQKSSAVAFGREWIKPDIDRVVASNPTPDEVLRQLDLVDFGRYGVRATSRRASHGTHMTDLATGYGAQADHPCDPFVSDPDGVQRANPANNIAVITVQLPFLMTQESSGATYEPFVAAAVDYVLDRANKLCELNDKSLPLFINFSYAIAGGPHNGKSFLEQRIEKSLKNYRIKDEGARFGGVTLVVPSGNRYMERGHSQHLIDDTGTSDLQFPWRLLPGDQTSSFVEIWCSEGASGEVVIDLPEGKKIHYTIGQTRQAITSGNAAIGAISTDQPAGQDRKRILIAVAPTDTFWMPPVKRRHPAPSGLWSIGLRLTGAKSGTYVDAWIQRDESPYLYRANALQSYFDDPDYQRFNSDPDFGPLGDVAQRDTNGTTVRREGTLSGIATLNDLVVVGGRFAQTDATASKVVPALYAGEGFENSRGGKSIPDVSAVSDRSRALSGVLAAGTAAGSTVAFSGTSVAAPQVTRWLVETYLTQREDPTNSSMSNRALVDQVRIELTKKRRVPNALKPRLGLATLSRLYEGQHSLNRPFDTKINTFL